MSRPVLVSHHLCPYVQRAVIALKEKVVSYDRIDIDLADKPAWFTALSPLGKVPLMRVGEAAIFESAAILEYLEETTASPLHPIDPLQRARHRGWIEFASATLDAIAGFYNAPDAPTLEIRRRALADRFGWLQKHLDAGPFFAGDRFHLVDCAWGPVFRYLDTFDRIADFGLLDAAPNVGVYRKALADRASVATAVAPDYPTRLARFLVGRNSRLSELAAAQTLPLAT